MNKATSYIVVVLACTGIVIIYAVIGALLGWKHGGGVLPMIILFGTITATWNGIIGFSKEKILKTKLKMLKMKTITPNTHGILHTDFSGLQRFVARKKVSEN